MKQIISTPTSPTLTKALTSSQPSWVRGPLSQRYFLEEWGQVQLRQEDLFEHLCLLVFHTGLAWEQVLAYRQPLAQALFYYDVAEIAAAPASYYEELLETGPIIRNRRKLDACFNNARALEDSGLNLAELLLEAYPLPLAVEGGYRDLPQVTERSQQLALTLKAAGLKHLSAKTVCSLLQATGLIHLRGQAETKKEPTA